MCYWSNVSSEWLYTSQLGQSPSQQARKLGIHCSIRKPDSLYSFCSFFFLFFFLLLSRTTPTALLYESITVKLFPFVNLFNPPRVNSTYFFLQCHPRITLTHEGHEKKRKWSPTEEALNCWMNSPCQYLSKFLENSVENMHADVRVWRVRKNVSTELLHNFWGGVYLHSFPNSWNIKCFIT